jgi:hypothetical protein
MNNEWKIYRREWPWPNSGYYPGIWLEELNKTTNTSVNIGGLLAEILT